MSDQCASGSALYLLFAQGENIGYDVNIAGRMDIVIILAVGNGREITDVGVVFAVCKIKPTVTSGEVDGPENIFVDFAFLEPQSMFADIYRTGERQPQVMMPFSLNHVVPYPLLAGERLTVRLFAVHRDKMVTGTVCSPATEHGNIGLRFMSNP